MELLGSQYEYGRGVGQDFNLAMKWYGKSAQAGNPMAMYKVGMLYEDGAGVAPDDDEARRWFRRSAGGGLELAKKWLAEHGEN
jgi:hypothetical protein